MSGIDLRQVDRAVVDKAGQPAATLQRDPRGVVFAYRPDYAGPAVASTLPLTPEPTLTPGGGLPPFFSGLLPEGRRLAAIRRAVKTSADDELTLLLAVGDDAIGDVRIRADGPLTAPAPTPAPDLADVTFTELYGDLLAANRHDSVAIAGAQDKVSGQMISLPVRHHGAAWILKLDPPNVPHLVENEAFFLRAARASGLTVAHAEIIRDRAGKPGLLVRRFDRLPGEKGFDPLAQEDALQALGRYPADKYRVTTEEVIDGLTRLTAAPAVAARDLLRQFAFAYLTGNGDLHGKNVSVLQTDGEWRVSPAYDLPSSQPYGDHTMALTIGGKDREDLGRADFVALGERSGIPPKATMRVLDDLLRAMPRWHGQLDELPFDDRIVHKLRKACEYRADRLRG